MSVMYNGVGGWEECGESGGGGWMDYQCLWTQATKLCIH